MSTDRVGAWHADLLCRIRDLADPQYREGSLMVARTSQRVHGVCTPELRRLARDWKRRQRDADAQEVLTLADSLWNGESRDERALGLEILSLHPQVVRDLAPDWFDRWRIEIDNWAVGDILATRILGPWAAADPGSRLAYLESLIGDRHLYSRRLGLVASVPLNRKGPSHGRWTLRQVDRLIDERDPMITKAVSWALRQMIEHQADAVTEYVESRSGRLAALARREVRNKLTTGRKSGRSG